MIFITSGSARTGIVFRCPANQSNLGNEVEADIIIFFGSITKKKEGNPSRQLSILINFGVLEYWSIGVMTKGLMSFFFNTPILHHSSTPRPKIYI